MEFYEVLDQVLSLLPNRGRVTYRALKLQFKLDDDQLETLKDEILYAYPQVVDDNGRGLVWTGEAPLTPSPVPTSATDQEHMPLAYTPPHLTARILASRQALEGKRQQVTVLFADSKDSTELIKDLLGDIAARYEPPNSAQAEAHYRQALALTEALGMHPFQAHCHRRLGTLYRQMGWPAKACTALSTAIELYHAIDMAFWLPQAEIAPESTEGQE